MNRAEVWRERGGGRPVWCAGVCHWRDRASATPIHQRDNYMDSIRVYPTHAEALAHALAAVGLAPEEGR